MNGPGKETLRVLVVGGAGYIGSFVTHQLAEQGFEVLVFDNLSTGHREAIPPGIPFIQGDLADAKGLRSLFQENSFLAVMHFSARALVGESMENPLLYYRSNVAYTINLLDAMVGARVPFFIFSSSAAVFGAPETVPIPESHPLRPVNPYGHTKAMVEQILQDLSHRGALSFVSLRYFNAAGASRDGNRGEDHCPETHLIPRVIRSALHGDADPLEIYGTDYPTPDGTCIRDYIHVEDLARAHLLALQYLSDGGPSTCFNLGNGRGYSVREVVGAVERVVGRSVPIVEGPRRPGDPPILVASSERIRRTLGWAPEYPEIERIVETAYRWHSTHPSGYAGEADT
jgi:UDP-glucose 4-epimerase